MRVKIEAAADAQAGAEAGAEAGGSAEAMDRARQSEKGAAGGQAGTPAASRSALAPSSMPMLTPAKSSAAAAKPVTLLSSPHGVVPVTPSKARGVHAAGSVDGVGSLDDGEPQVKIVCSLEELDDSDSEERQRERMERAAHLKYMALAQGQCVLCGRSMSYNPGANARVHAALDYSFVACCAITHVAVVCLTILGATARVHAALDYYALCLAGGFGTA